MKNFIDWLRDDWNRKGLVSVILIIWLAMAGAVAIVAFFALLKHLFVIGSYGSIILIWIGVPVGFVLIAYILRDKEN